MKRLLNYIIDTKNELRHVSWPTSQTTTLYTILVIVISFAIAVYLGAFDFIFSYILEQVII